MGALMADMASMVGATTTALNSLTSGGVTPAQLLLTGFAGIVGIGVVARFFGILR